VVDIRNFKGLMYNPDKSGDLSLNICPPFDVISPNLQNELYSRSQFNLIRLEFGKEFQEDTENSNKYIRAANFLNDWFLNNILVYDDSFNFYLTEEEFSFQNHNYSRTGITVLVKLEDLENGYILPHENTRSGPKEDRLSLMKETKCNFSPLMSLYNDESGKIKRIIESYKTNNPKLTINFNESKLKLWKVKDLKQINEIKKHMMNKKLMLADGHHRYETSINYQEKFSKSKESNESSNFRLMTLFSLDDPGVLMLGYHRVVFGLSNEEKNLLKNFLTVNAENVMKGDINDFNKSENDFNILVINENDSLIYTFKSKNMYDNQYKLLNDYILKNIFDDERLNQVIDYQHDFFSIQQSVKNKEIDFGFIMKPLNKNKFEDLVMNREKLPPKSTFFHPKLHSGLVIQNLDSEVNDNKEFKIV
tara:strand:- start:5298 stop:6557 length:1260 start_codon:yes stop_codon:yes gene_type:complete